MADSDGLSGTPVHVGCLARSLAARGVDVHVLAGLAPHDGLGACGAIYHVMRGGEAPVNLASFVRFVLATSADLGLTVLHAHYWPAMFACQVVRRAQGLPYVVTLHGREYTGEVAFSRTDRWMAAISEASAVIGVSRYLLESMAERLPLPAVRHVIPDPVDTVIFRPTPWSAVVPGRIVYCGRMAEEKGPDIAVEAFARSRCWQNGSTLWMVGPDDGMLEALRHRVSSAGIAEHVVISGPVAHGDVGNVFASATVVVVPSRSEACGTVVLEAMTVGRPVVAARVGGIPEWITHGENGLLCVSGDIGGFAQSLALIERDPWMARTLGVAASIRAEQCRDVNVADRVAAVLEAAGQ